MADHDASSRRPADSHSSQTAQTAPTPATPAPAAPAPAGPPSAGRRRWPLPLYLLVAVALVLGVGIGAVALLRLPRVGDWFGVRTVDRSQPVLLVQMRDLSRFVAAEGSYQVVVDLQRDRRYVPDFLLKERTLLVGAGTVEAYVDFAALAPGSVTVSDDRRSASLRLPQPQLAPTRLDLGRSYIFAEQRGVLNRLGEVFGGNPDRQREAFLLAERRIGEAAAQGGGLVERARASARRMLEGLLRALGYTSVTVTFPTS